MTYLMHLPTELSIIVPRQDLEKVVHLVMEI